LVDTVKRAPGDAAARMFLWQVMALSGEWDKAGSQLRQLAQVSAEAQMLATVYDQAMAAEKTRADAYAGQAPFNVLVASSPWIVTLAKSLDALAGKDAATAERLRDEAFEAAGDTPGVIGEQKFGWIADVDPRLGPCFEAIVAGAWGLVPFEAVSWIKTEGPRDLRDVIWLPVQMMLRSGQSAAALMPARYPGSETLAGEFQLGRSTAWIERSGGEVPVGQKLWTTDGDIEFGLLDFNELQLA
jgi:type VI secretion system protein ImpE